MLCLVLFKSEHNMNHYHIHAVVNCFHLITFVPFLFFYVLLVDLLSSFALLNIPPHGEWLFRTKWPSGISAVKISSHWCKTWKPFGQLHGHLHYQPTVWTQNQPDWAVSSTLVALLLLWHVETWRAACGLYQTWRTNVSCLCSWNLSIHWNKG